MASVFGVPISVDTLKATALYEEPITQKDLADYAMMMMNDGRDAEAREFLDKLKERYGIGESAKCLIYNATGTTLNFVTNKNWHGQISDTPYPSVILNGQWGAYLHVHQSVPPAGSEGAVVYRCKAPSSSGSCDWLLCWGIPYVGNNGVYTEIREEGHFPEHWDYIYHEKLECADRSSTDSGYGYVSNTQIGEGTTVEVRAVFQFA